MRKINAESILRAVTTNNAICTISPTKDLNRMKTINSRSIMNMIRTLSTTIIATSMVSTMNTMSYVALRFIVSTLITRVTQWNKMSTINTRSHYNWTQLAPWTRWKHENRERTIGVINKVNWRNLVVKSLQYLWVWCSLCSCSTFVRKKKCSIIISTHSYSASIERSLC